MKCYVYLIRRRFLSAILSSVFLLVEMRSFLRRKRRSTSSFSVYKILPLGMFKKTIPCVEIIEAEDCSI